MNSPASHPTVFDLDCLAAGGGRAETRAHLENCAQCSEQVRRVQADLPVPAWLAQVGRSRRTSLNLRLVEALVGFTALAAVALLLVYHRHPAVVPKGPPTIALFIRHQGVIARWDGKSPIHPGDELRAEVAAEGFSSVTVAAPRAGAPEVLYSGPAEASPTLVPRAWVVDAEPGPESLVFVFSRRAGPVENLAEVIARGERTGDIWIVQLEMSKLASPAEETR